MVLKVSHKVAIGFSVILLLLLFSSISSIGILTDIEAATAKVDNYALPIQKHGNAVQKQILKQAKSAALIPTLPNEQAIEQLQVNFQAQDVILQENLLAISKLLSAFPNIKNLDEFTQAYNAYSQAVAAMFAFRKQELAKTSLLHETQDSLYITLDEASAILGDLSFLEDSENQRQIDTIVGSANQIEGYLYNLIDASKTILAIDNIAEVEASQQTMAIGIENIEQLQAHLVRLGEDYDTQGLIEMFVEEFARTKAALTLDNNLFEIKISQLEQKQGLLLSAQDAEREINIAITTIDTFLQAVDDNLMALQLDTLANVEQGNLETIVVFIILFILGVVIAFITIRAMTASLSEINVALAQIAKGDLSQQLTVKSEDEYGQVAKNVNLVVADLCRLIGNIRQNSHLMLQAAGQSSEQISQVSDSLVQQEHTIEQTNVQTDELAESADQIQQQAKGAEEQMTGALVHSQKLELTTNKASQGMQRLTQVLDNTTSTMTSLEQEANNITSILDTIGSISEQTNLLALNAAIEAARAGEVGRGFAVVADEVRLLASRTQQSAGEIQQMIESLQRQTKQAVQDIQSGRSEAVNCQQDTEQLLEIQQLISDAINQIHSVSRDISSAAYHQSDLTKNINDNVEAVVDLSRQSSEKSVTTQSYSQQVAELAEQLEKAIGAFKVPNG
ncbi:methyl-accepting chemotaxis protein [Litorilituus sediminis]|uniref:Methyl-accepting chemotaxis protein n=1 Tax=Litorilituus sediminis TaxID=718192 RepID=A0A4P6P8V3_9GAMM|nr:methyl-accepting chemotaxis protein [Litorilituus sediminis]QBG36729.1 methyl-accepting chemotaxis protein [Litorilituus sediminis]